MGWEEKRKVKNWLETQHQKENYYNSIWSHHFLVDRRGKVEAVTDFIFFGSKITADGDCSHDIKRHFLLGRKAMTNLGSVFKSRIHSADKSLYSQRYGLFQ